MDPPESESFLRAWSMERGDATRPSPFDDAFTLTRQEYEKRLRVALDPLFPASSEAHIAEAIDEPAMELLAKLEEAVNTTSLVLLFHVGEAWMLFPGDAQWGTWNAILNDPFRSKLLENLTFYKIGHHGSHNATPVSFVERYVKKDQLAMLPYGMVAKWPSIPRAKLLQALHEKGVVMARSDEAPPAQFTTKTNGGETLAIDLTLPA